jgi:hypothetical protein
VMPSGRLVVVSVNETPHLLAERTTALPVVLDEGVA